MNTFKVFLKMPLILYRLLWCFKPVYPVNMMRLVLFAVCIALSVAIPSTSYDKKIGYGHGYVNNNDTDVIVWENYHNKYLTVQVLYFFFITNIWFPLLCIPKKPILLHLYWKKINVKLFHLKRKTNVNC